MSIAEKLQEIARDVGAPNADSLTLAELRDAAQARRDLEDACRFARQSSARMAAIVRGRR